jgi:hypothetical protein
MKKVMLIAAIACFIGSGSVFASTTSVKNIEFAQQKDKKKKVNEEDLPDAIKRYLGKDTYKDWKVDQAYLFEEAGYYKIELKKDDQTQTLNLDKYGNKVSVME